MTMPTRTFECRECGRTLETWHGQDVQCQCGKWHNAFGQQLRDNWMDNPSNWDDEIGDVEGYEIQMSQYE